MHVYDLKACQAILEEMKPGIGNYDLFFRLMRMRASKTGLFPKVLYKYFKKMVNPRKPYFIGTLRSGEKFMGKFDDWFACILNVLPDYDEGLFTGLKANVNKGKSCLDIGANMGLTAVIMGKALDSGNTVYAFEPIPETARRAAATIALNNVSNVRLVDIALGNSNGSMSVDYFPESTATVTFLSLHQEKLFGTDNFAAVSDKDLRTVEVEIRRLDDVGPEIGIKDCGFIKIDVEGFEYSVMEGALSFLSAHHPKILFEFNTAMAPVAGWTVETMVELFNKAGTYKTQFLTEEGTLTEKDTSHDQPVNNVLCVPA